MLGTSLHNTLGMWEKKYIDQLPTKNNLINIVFQFLATLFLIPPY